MQRIIKDVLSQPTGRVASTNQVGKGSTFRVRFPSASMTEYPGAKSSTDKSA